jgi:hypothetical protein
MREGATATGSTLKRRSIIAGFKREHVPAPAAVAGAAVYAIITASRAVLGPKSERMRGCVVDGRARVAAR